MANQTWIRKYLTDRGYADKDVGWDGDRNVVTLQGKDFYSATPTADGRTYAELGDLDKALSSFDQASNRSQLKTLSDSMIQKSTATPVTYQAPPPVQTYTPPPAYAGFDADNNAAYQAALRSAARNAGTATNNAMADLNKRGILNSTITGDRAAQLQQGEFGRVSDTILPQLMQQDYSQYRDSVADAFATDQENNRRQQQGFANQFAIDQANYGLTQDELNNLSKVVAYLSGQSQQDFNNQLATNEADRQTRNDNISLAQWLTNTYGTNAVPKSDAGVAFDQVAGQTPIVGQQQQQAADQQQLQNLWAVAANTGTIPDELAAMYNLPRGSKTLDAVQSLSQLAISQQNANTSSASAANSADNAAFGRLMDIWQATGLAPAGIDGVRAGTPYRPAGSSGTQPDLNAYIKTFNDRYLYKNPDTDQMTVSDPAALRTAILALDLPDDADTDRLLTYYGLPTN